MATTVNTIPAYITIAFDLDGKVKIQQIQERLVIRDGETVINGSGEGELLPIKLITAPLPNDKTEATLKQALDAATAGALLRATELEAHNAVLTEERDRLRIVVSAFPEMEPSLAPENPAPGPLPNPAWIPDADHR